MVTDSLSQGSRPGETKSFTIKMPATRKERIVATMAIPPPRAMVLRWYRSAVGTAMKPMREANFVTIQVSIAETANDATSRIIARISIFIILL